MIDYSKSDVAELMNAMHAEENTTRESAQGEYARDTSNALANFDRIGAMVNCPHCSKPIGPLATLMVYLLKHVDGVLAYIGGNRSQREPVQDRIKDIRVYCALLRALVERTEAREIAAAPQAPDDHGADGPLMRERLGLCLRCGDTGVIETGNNDLPCDCPKGDTAMFNHAGFEAPVTGAWLKSLHSSTPVKRV